MSASLTSGSFRPVGIGAAVLSSFAHYGRLIWAALEALGQRRARAHLLTEARLHAGINPEAAERLAACAAELRSR